MRSQYTLEEGEVAGVMTLTQPRVRRSQNLTVLSCDPLTNIAPPQLYRVKTCPANTLHECKQQQN